MMTLNNMFMKKVNRMEMRKTHSGKLYTIIYVECNDRGRKIEETIILDECGHPTEIPTDIIESMELVKMHMYYSEKTMSEE